MGEIIPINQNIIKEERKSMKFPKLKKGMREDLGDLYKVTYSALKDYYRSNGVINSSKITKSTKKYYKAHLKKSIDDRKSARYSNLSKEYNLMFYIQVCHTLINLIEKYLPEIAYNIIRTAIVKVRKETPNIFQQYKNKTCKDKKKTEFTMSSQQEQFIYSNKQNRIPKYQDNINLQNQSQNLYQQYIYRDEPTNSLNYKHMFGLLIIVGLFCFFGSSQVNDQITFQSRNLQQEITSSPIQQQSPNIQYNTRFNQQKTKIQWQTGQCCHIKRDYPCICRQQKYIFQLFSWKPRPMNPKKQDNSVQLFYKMEESLISAIYQIFTGST